MSSTPPTDRDQSLLARLNALKPSSVVTLERSANKISLNPLGPAAVAEPPSAEDALTARLRVLRNGGSPAQSPPPPSPAPSPPAKAGPTPTLAYRIPFSVSSTSAGPGADQDSFALAPTEDDQALAELLEGLGFDPEAAAEAEEEAWGQPDPAAEESRVRARLEEIRGASRETDRDDSDDSDAEPMRREVENVLSRARDEAALEWEAEVDAEAEKGDATAAEGKRDPDDSLQAPSPSADIARAHDEKEEQQLVLPTVPSLLVDPPDAAGDVDNGADEGGPTRKSLDFENDIIVRMAALKGFGAGVNTDVFGLPSAPTFQPEERRPTVTAKKKTANAGRVGFTDEDQKTWCIVCLDDATVRCIGCDDDVYCARCWREMHVGPRAGYEERGHQWAKFQR